MSECMCDENWRKIIAESKDLLGECFYDIDRVKYRFSGVMHGEDDYYYVMVSFHGHSYSLYPCSMFLDDYGFKLDESQQAVRQGQLNRLKKL